MTVIYEFNHNRWVINDRHVRYPSGRRRWRIFPTLFTQRGMSLAPNPPDDPISVIFYTNNADDTRNPPTPVGDQR